MFGLKERSDAILFTRASAKQHTNFLGSHKSQITPTPEFRRAIDYGRKGESQVLHFHFIFNPDGC